MCTYVIIPVLGFSGAVLGSIVEHPFVGPCHHPPAPSLHLGAPFLSPPSVLMCSTGSFSSQIPTPALAFALDGTLQSSFLALFLGLARIYFLQGKAFSLSSHVINSGSGWIEETDKSGHGRCTIIPSCGRLSQEVHEFVLAWAVYWDPWQWGRMRGSTGVFWGLCSYQALQVVYSLLRFSEKLLRELHR